MKLNTRPASACTRGGKALMLAGISLAAMATVMAGGASAQTGAKDRGDGDDTKVEEIVVTGTLIRGIAPPGSNTVNLDERAIQATGKSSVNDVLSYIPQITTGFNTVPVGTSGNASPTVRPSLRSLGGAGGATTLLLLNGHRMVGAGVLQTAADPSIIPPAVLQKVEVVPDGGSSTYGSDAIGGVINFITRKSFDGVEVSGRYGVGSDFRTQELNLTGGTRWELGSGLLAYSYAEHGDILGGDRDFVTQNSASTGGADFRSTACAPGNLTVGGVPYALPGRVAGVTNRCDTGDFATVYPHERRDTVFGAVNQRLSDLAEFNMTGYWSRRRTESLGAMSTLSGSIRSTNPYFQPIGSETIQSVGLSFSPVFGVSNQTRQRFVSYGVTPSVDFTLPADWNLAVSGNLGHSNNRITADAVDQAAAAAALAGTTTATALNPYNLAGTNGAVLAALRNYGTGDYARQDLREARVVADGPLFTVGGGLVRLALGAENHHEKLYQEALAGARVGMPLVARGGARRTVNSVYGELFVPLVGSANAKPFVKALALSLSARYDDYSDVGATTNPKIGVSYTPFDALVLRANYGTSFQAPSLADSGGGVDTRAQVAPNSLVRPPTSAPSDFLRSSIVLAGGGSGITPQEADTWQVGADLRPAPGLVLSLTYWDIAFTNAIQTPPFFAPTFFSDPSYAGLYILNPTLAQAQAVTAGMRLDGAASIAGLYANGASPYIIIDARRTNLGAVNLNGLDFNIAYRREAPFGSMNASLGGTYILKRETRASPTGAFVDNLKNGTGRLNVVALAGAQAGAMRTQATLRYTGDYPVVGIVGQSQVDSYVTTDLLLGYIMPQGLLKGVDLTLNLDNVFDKDPPHINTSTGYANGFTLGRTATFGVRKRF